MKPSVNGKVGAGAFAGALSVILVWGISLFAGKDAVPPEIAAAFTTVLTFAVSWVVPDMIADTVEAQEGNKPTNVQPIAPVTRPGQAVLN